MVGRAANQAFQHVQRRAGGKQFGRRGIGEKFARPPGIARTRCVAHAHQHTARAVDAQRIDEFLAQCGHRRAVEQHHARFAQPDVAAVEGEAKSRGKVAYRYRLLSHRLGFFAALHAAPRSGHQQTFDFFLPPA
jgi:hypothetical protein